MKLKVLPLDTWMKMHFVFPEFKEDFEACVKKYKKILPIFNRNGIYKYGKTCWFESFGLAYEYDATQFEYELNVLHASELSDKQAQALKNIIDQKLSTKKQRELFHYWKDAMNLNGIRTGRNRLLCKKY